MPKISVIVPVYNVEKYLYKCVNSILAQTFTDFELILINDGSQDSSGAICDEYAAKDKRIITIHQENQGQATARNNAIAIAKGEWIHFVDSDDFIHPQMLEVLYSAVNETTLISMCGMIEGLEPPINFSESRSIKALQTHHLTDDVLFSFYSNNYSCWVVCAKLIKKEIIDKFPFVSGKIYEDTGVVYKWLNETQSIAVTDEPLYFYRLNPKSTTRKDFSLKKLDLLWALEEQIAYYKTKKYKKVLNLICSRYAVHCADFYYKVINELKLHDEANTLKEKLKKHIKDNKNYINLENWEFNLVYGALYSKPIRILYRLKRFITNITKLKFVSRKKLNMI